jgi:uncharacterized protein YbjT (DUF2867 family)
VEKLRKETAMILISGATGNVGAELVAALVRAGEPVRALVRNPGTALADGVEPAVGDLNEPASVTPALRGANAVFLLSGYRDMAGLLAEIRLAGVERVVLLSGGAAAATDVDNAVSRYMIVSEDAVRASGIEWTIVRPYAFMSNALRWVPELSAGDVLRAPFAGVANAAIDPSDIAAVAALGLISGDHAGAVYRLSGPEAMRPADQLRVLAERLGRDLRLEPLSDEEARAQMLTTTPVEYVEAFFSFYVDGTIDESPVLPTVTELTGAPPRTFVQWTDAHIDAFR